jgi:hypothetical protein
LPLQIRSQRKKKSDLATKTFLTTKKQDAAKDHAGVLLIENVPKVLHIFPLRKVFENKENKYNQKIKNLKKNFKNENQSPHEDLEIKHWTMLRCEEFLNSNFPQCSQTFYYFVENNRFTLAQLLVSVLVLFNEGGYVRQAENENAAPLTCFEQFLPSSIADNFLNDNLKIALVFERGEIPQAYRNCKALISCPKENFWLEVVDRLQKIARDQKSVSDSDSGSKQFADVLAIAYKKYIERKKSGDILSFVYESPHSVPITKGWDEL